MRHTVPETENNSKSPDAKCCAICYEDIRDDTGFTRLSCSHLYHLSCIVKWLTLNPTCPCCRKNLSEYENITQTHTRQEENEIRGDNVTDDEIREIITYGEMIEAAIVQLHLPPHILRMPLALNTLE
jgi:hypothetical protein